MINYTQDESQFLNNAPGTGKYDGMNGYLGFDYPSWVTPPAAAADAGGGAPPAAEEPTGGAYQGYYAQGGSAGPDYGFYTDAPAFDWQNPYGDFSYADFQAPDAQGMFADPGYQFRLGQGRQALEQSAAGRGILRTGGTLKDILGYGQNMASQEYGNVFDRAARTYDTNRGNAFQNYTTNYGNAFQLAREQYAPKFASWQTKMNLGQSAADLAFAREWDAYVHGNLSAQSIFDGPGYLQGSGA